MDEEMNHSLLHFYYWENNRNDGKVIYFTCWHLCFSSCLPFHSNTVSTTHLKFYLNPSPVSSALVWLWPPRARTPWLYHGSERNACSSNHPYKSSTEKILDHVTLFSNPSLNSPSLSPIAPGIEWTFLQLRSSVVGGWGFTHWATTQGSNKELLLLIHFMLLSGYSSVTFRTEPH